MRLVLILAALTLAGCAAPAVEPTPPTPAPTSLSLTSAFADNATIPTKHTCDGENVSPSLAITGAGNATTIALTVLDLNAS